MEIDKKESNGCLVDRKHNGLQLFPVCPYTSGEGLPYAPVDWPCLGDKWSWKVGKRIIASGGYFLDRHLFLPARLQSKPKGRGFVSKISVEQYVRDTYPGTDVKAFFNSFSWRIPFKSPSEIKEHSGPGSHNATSACKAGNKLCSSLTEPGKPPSAIIFCDICCSEPGFCRNCCCILCSKTIDPADGSYGFIRCQSLFETNICGHSAHLECALKSNMAGTVGGCVCLDVEYYCRRCDTRTDLLPHVKKFLQICESISSCDEIKKILQLGACVLHGSRRSEAKRLLHYFDLAMGKQHDPRLEIGTVLDGVRNVDDSSAGTQGVMYHNANHAVKSAIDEEHVDKVSKKIDPAVESSKLEYDVDQTLQALKKSQELEYNIAKERLCEQKNCILSLYEQLDKEKSEIALHLAYVADPDALLQLTESTVDQIKKELSKLEDLKSMLRDSIKPRKEILKQHFGLEM